MMGWAAEIFGGDIGSLQGKPSFSGVRQDWNGDETVTYVEVCSRYGRIINSCEWSRSSECNIISYLPCFSRAIVLELNV